MSVGRAGAGADQRHLRGPRRQTAPRIITAMERNVGRLDQVLRLAFAGVLFYLGFVPNPVVASPTSQWVVGLFGLLPLTTALLRFCPLYTLIGFSTCPRVRG